MARPRYHRPMLWTLAVTAAFIGSVLFIMNQSEKGGGPLMVVAVTVAVAAAIYFAVAPRPNATDCVTYSQFASTC